jgi:hypothetical protein
MDAWDALGEALIDAGLAFLDFSQAAPALYLACIGAMFACSVALRALADPWRHRLAACLASFAAGSFLMGAWTSEASFHCMGAFGAIPLLMWPRRWGSEPDMGDVLLDRLPRDPET